jgi:SAM-dependent methyltransferase
MPSKSGRLRTAVWAWRKHGAALLEWGMLGRSLSSREKHFVYSGLLDEAGLFHPSYEGWREKRLAKILEIYGAGFFAGRKVLELGAGHGDLGASLAKLGADVLCLDGRAQNVNFARVKHRKAARLRFEQFNLENDFSRFGRFDLIVNFGLIYHLRNVEAHLRCCFSVADDILLESVVCDSTDPHAIFFSPERTEVDEESLEGIGSRPSPFYIERLAAENSFAITRCFTADLNYTHQFRYDWEHRNDGRLSDDFVLRRFWRFKKVRAS